MRLIAIMPVRNEDWILGLSARAALMWADMLIVLDHASTDATRDILVQIAGEVGNERIMWLTERDAEWREMDHRQLLLTAARGAKATHIATLDADEIATGDCINAMRCAADACIAGYYGQLPGYNLRGGITRYHADGLWANRWFSVAFKDHQNLHWKGDGYHHREPMGMVLHNRTRPVAHGDGGIMHLWGASERRLRAKHAAYKVTERLRFPAKPVAEIERTYNLWRSPQDCRECGDRMEAWAFNDVPRAWWEPYGPLMKHLHVDAEPWQERYVREAVAKHGAEMFRGLDLFGVEK